MNIYIDSTYVYIHIHLLASSPAPKNARLFNGEAEGGSVDLDEALEITGLLERLPDITAAVLDVHSTHMHIKRIDESNLIYISYLYAYIYTYIYTHEYAYINTH